jgi:hypothetical protein
VPLEQVAQGIIGLPAGSLLHYIHSHNEPNGLERSSHRNPEHDARTEKETCSVFFS